VPHPSVSLLSADCPIDAIWRAVLAQDEMALAAIDLAAGPVWLLVQRLATGVEVARVDEGPWRFAAELFAGRPLGTTLSSAGNLDAPSLLAEHIAAGRFIAFSLDDAAAHVAAPAQENRS